MGERVAEERHAPPHHEAAERPGERGDADAAEHRADDEVIQHGALLGMLRLSAGAPVLRHHLAGEVVGVIVLVGVDREARGRARAEQRRYIPDAGSPPRAGRSSRRGD